MGWSSAYHTTHLDGLVAAGMLHQDDDVQPDFRLCALIGVTAERRGIMVGIQGTHLDGLIAAGEENGQAVHAPQGCPEGPGCLPRTFL